MSDGGTPSRNREHTRTLLLDSALEVFSEEGFGRSTVERVCERAGFTRGAFYSNFDSLDQLFLAVWERHSAYMLADVHAAVGAIQSGTGEYGAGSPCRPADAVAPRDPVRACVSRILAAIPVDERWFRITAEFSAHALRHPELTRVVAARERAIREALLPVVEVELAREGRRVVDREMLGRALVALHDGTSVQCVMEPAETTRLALRTELFTTLLLAFSAANAELPREPQRSTTTRSEHDQ